MTKTPEQLAVEWLKEEYGDTSNWTYMGQEMSLDAFYAGYQAAKPQWISVKERLPEIPDNDYSNRVLLLRADRFIVIARIEKCVRFVRPFQEAFFIETEDGDQIEEFTHWMPLPKPPEGEK
jgi:hypothetical protein